MKAVIAKVKKSVSLVLAVMMVLTAIPQTSYAVYGADQSISENDTLNVDTETTVDETAATEETVEAPVEVIEEDILEDDSLEVEEETLLMEDTPSGKFRFDANGGTMPIDDNAINTSEDVDGKCTWQEFEYFKENGNNNKYGVRVTNIDNISPNKEGYRFNGWYYEDGSVLKLSDYFDNPNVDRTVYAKWIEQISSTPVIVSYYGNENGIKYIKKGNSLNVSLKVSRESFPLSELGEGESIVLYYWYGSDKTVYDGSYDEEDGYYQRWNGYPLTVYNMNSDAEITFKLFDNVDFDTANVKIKLKYCIVTDGPYIHQDFANVVDEGGECIINDTYSDISKLNFVVSKATQGYTGYSSGVKLYEKESDGYYRELRIECDDDDNPKYEFRNGKEIAMYFFGFLEYESDPEDPEQGLDNNSLQPTRVFSKIPNIDEWTELEKKAINVKKDNSNPAEINLIENCYIIPANRTNSDLQIEVDTRLSYTINKISFNNTEEAEYSVSYSNVPGEANCWTDVESGCINSPMTVYEYSFDEEEPWYKSNKQIEEGDIIYLRFESHGEDKKIGKITSSAGKIYKTTINGIECYKLDLNNLDSNIEDLKVNFSFIEDNEGVGEVCYYDGDVDITVMDGDTPVEGFITERISGNYSRNLYKLTNDRKYTLEIRCKDGYYFNGKGVEFNGRNMNKNTAEPYIKTNFVAGNKISAYTGECVHLIFNNANTTYGGKGIAPSVKYYTQSDTAKTAKTKTPNKTANDGSCEYYLPVLDENSDCRYEVAVNPKDANGSPVSATLVGTNPQEIKYGKNREVKIPVDSYRLGKYEWNVECVSNKAIPNITYVENDQPKTINPTTANGNIFNVPWNRQFFITEVNKEGRKSKITACSAECDGIDIGNKLTVHIGIGGDSEVIFWGLGSEYAGKTINVKLFTDISSSSGNTVTLKVAPAITKVTVSGVKSAGPAGAKYQALVQEIASTKEYAYTLSSAEKNSFDDLRVHVCAAEGSAPADNSSITEKTSNDYVDVTLNAAGKKLIVNTKNKKPSDQASYIVIFNKSTDKKVAGFYINTTTPAWAKSAPTVKATSTNDTEAKFIVTAPSIKTLNSNYYVKIKLLPNSNTQLPSYLKLDEEIKYIPVGSDGTISKDDLTLKPYIIKTKDPQEAADELGEGCGAKFDAEVSVVLTESGNDPATSSDEVITETVAKKVTVTTVAARYADKITLKKSATNSIYAATNEVAVATVDLGKNTDFKTTDFWKVKGIVDASGNDVTSKFTSFGNGKYVSHYDTAEGKVVTETRGDVDANSLNVYVTPKTNTPAGKYKVIVQTVIGGTPQAVEAAGEFTVLPTIANLTISIDGQYTSFSMYKKAGTALSKKITVSATDQDGKVIKNPKVKYEIKKYVNDTPEPASDSEISIKNNTINVAKDFDAGNSTEYRIIAHPDDVPGKQPYYIDLFIKSSTQNIGKLELYEKVGGQYSLITSDKEISFSKRDKLYIKVFAKDGTCLFQDENGDPEEHWSNSEIWLDHSKLDAVKGPGTVQLTACGLDGTKASASVNIAYDDGDDFNKLLVRYTGSSKLMTDEEDKKSIDISDKPASEILYLSLCNSSSNKTYSEGYGIYQYLIKGTMKTEGLKVLEKSSNSQYMKVQLTKPTATVKFTDKDKVEHVWTIKNNALSQVEAPKVASMVVNGINGTDKVYANYVYDAENDDLVLTLKNPIMNASKEVIPASDITVEMIPSTHANFAGTPEYSVTNTGTSAKPKYIATITVPIKGKLSGKTTLEFAYKDKTTGNYLTKTNTVATISPVAFKKSFAVNSTINMSLKDAYTVEIAASKKTGVKSVTYENLLNFNKNGVYNEFADTFKINADKKTITVKDASKLIFKKNLPTALDGYVVAHVVYENGEEADVTSKVTVKWVAQVGKYFIEKNNVPAVSPENYYTFTLQDASKNTVGYKDIKLAELKNDSPAIMYIVEYGMGEDVIGVAGNLKPGTYKSTALAILNSSGCPHTGTEGDEITDADWSTYGVQVPITIKVVP